MAMLCSILLSLLSSCATNDRPPCRRVTAEEFMRPHTFKGIPSDEFIGTTSAPGKFRPMPNEEKAFKKVWEMGWSHDWAILWCPAAELPRDYLANAKSKPNRKPPGSDEFIHE